MWANAPPLGSKPVRLACMHLPCIYPWSLHKSLLNEWLAVGEGWPEKQCLDLFGRFLLRSWQGASERERHWMRIKPLAFLSHHWTWIIHHLPRQKVPFWNPCSCSQHVIFPAASQTLRGRDEISEETWVTEICKRSRPPELVPSKPGWGIYSPSNAHTLFLSTVVLIVQPCEPSVLCQPETLDTEGEYFPVPCLLLLFWVSHLWTRGIFQIPRRVYWCHKFKCCGCSERGICSGGGEDVCGCHPSWREAQTRDSWPCSHCWPGDGGGLTALCRLTLPS